MPEIKKDRFGNPYVPPMNFEEYSDLYKDFFLMKRENGILEIRAHTEGGPIVWREAYHKALGDIARWAGRDPENEVIILTGSGDQFIGALDEDAVRVELKEALDRQPEEAMMLQFDKWLSARRVVENWVWDIHVPTIAALNGGTLGGAVWFFGLLDVFLAADDVYVAESHFKGGNVPGDGNFSVLQNRLGDVRANYMAYTGKPITAQQALDQGLINEVLPREKVLPRAWELAEEIMRQPRHIRRMTHELMRQRNLRSLMQDFLTQVSIEWWGVSLLFATKTSKLHEVSELLEKMKADSKK